MRIIYLTVITVLFGSINLSAQFGFSAKYNSNGYGNWNDFNEQVLNSSEKAFSTDIEISANYWLRLKEKRIEFLPEIFYDLTSSETISIPDIVGAENSLQKLGFNFNTHIYFMDLANDCDCPTFSKDGGGLQKAIHLILSPGVVYAKNELDIVDSDDVFDSNSLAFKFGAGLGFDIGFSDLLTLTPFFTINYSSSYSSDALRDMMINYYPFSSFAPLDSSNFQTQVGIRIGLRPDYVKGR